MKLIDLTDNQRVEYRIGRAGAESADYGPWKAGTLFVMHRSTGPVCLVAIREEPGWAEYGPDDYDARSDEWLVEDYYMQLRAPK